MLIDFQKIKQKKDLFIKKFLKKNIRLQVHYIPINSQPYYKKKYGFKKNYFRNSIHFFQREISLPIYYDLSNPQLKYILNNFKKIFNKFLKNK